MFLGSMIRGPICAISVFSFPVISFFAVFVGFVPVRFLSYLEKHL
jgi:hypothetical protein